MKTHSDNKNYQILVVDDNSVNLMYLSSLFKLNGFMVHEADNGEKALEELNSFIFDIVFLDLQLPGLDGFECAKIIREKEKQTGNHLPIIGLTGYNIQDPFFKEKKGIFDEILMKPIFEDQLLNLIQRFLK